ncbi:MAG: histidinol-phosphate transaminase [Salinisphaeraceae bacterium]|nr:histidinol-phosphate transaminase [Salinisphaeraceae bacterium]
MTLFDRANSGVAQLSPYEPGLPVETLKRQLGLSDIIKLASNENPLGCGASVRELLRDWRGELGRYPDGNGFKLKERLARHHKIDPDRITLGNGSNDLLELVGRVFLRADRPAMFSQYGFAIYKLVSLASGAPFIEIPAHPAEAAMPFGHDLDGFIANVGQAPGVIFVASPNNPTGTWCQAEEIERLLQAAPADSVVLLDEAYNEYLKPSLRPPSRAWLDKYPNLVVTRTFSKIHGLAALRVGYSLSSPEVADLLNRARQPFNVNQLALDCAEAALDDQAHVARSIELNTEERRRVHDALQSMGLTVLPSQANFLTFDCRQPSTPVYEALLRAGVIVRPMAGYGLPQHLRVTVGLPKENDRFLGALGRALETA